MSRSAADYSAKHTVSPEVKSISAKRLYRGVLECVKKLDASNQHRRNLISLFQPNQVKLRHKLREACERLLFTYPIEYGRKAEELLWKKVYYDVIHAVKSGRKFQSNAPGALQQRHLEPHFRQFLYSASGFYHYLLLRLQSKVGSGLVEIDFALAAKPLHARSSYGPSRSVYGVAKHALDEDEEEMEEWVKNTSYRLLVCLGDLSRYQMEFGGSRARANRFYQLALLARPNAGMPHNQLATLAGHHMWWGLVASYHYCRALHSELTFDGAEGNLQKLLDRNKKLFYQLPTDALNNVISADVYKKEHTRIFIVSFLYLCDLLRPKTYATDVEIAGLCKRLIDALIVCLGNMSDEVDVDALPAEENSHVVSAEPPRTQQKNHQGKRYNSRNRNEQSKSVVPNGVSRHAKHHHHHALQQQKLNEGIVFKICVLCLVNVHDLQSCRSNRSSAAIAFALAFFSHLLGQLVQCLSESNKPKTSCKKNAGDVARDSQADGDRVKDDNVADDKTLKKKGKSRMRRRRRAGGGEESDDNDLSEGEDALAAGDIGSDSDLTDDDSGSQTETYSESSGSGNRLSQEDLSSNDEDCDTPEQEQLDKEFATSDPKKANGFSNAELPQQNLASLQDLSNKMFQPSSLRHKITLAPSFLQNLAPPKSATPSAAKLLAEKSRENETSEAVGNGPENSATGTEPGPDQSNGLNGNGQKTPPKPAAPQRSDADRELAIRRLHKLTRHHHLTAAVKLLADWLWANGRVAAACAGSSRALWNRLVCFVNLLPTDKEMLDRGEFGNDPLLAAQLKEVVIEKKNLTEGCAGGSQSSDVGEGDVEKESLSKKEKTDVKPVIAIQKRPDLEAQAKLCAGWRQCSVLPEDRMVYKMKSIMEASNKSGIDFSSNYVEMSDLQQSVIRTCRLRHLCRSLSYVKGVDIVIMNEDESGLVGDEKFSGPEEEVVDPQMELEAVEAMRKARLMKDMATSRLRSEVQALESSLGAPKSRASALCLYLVPTVSALCYELPHLRRLVTSERFFVTIPKTVIDGLDSQKKELQGARDAIRYLEAEFKKGNRYIRAQSNDEAVQGVAGEAPKLRRQDVDAWRLYRIIECCRFLMQREANKSGNDLKEHSGLVTILTREKDSYSQEQASAFTTAKTLGIQVKSASAFVKSWSKTNSN